MMKKLLLILLCLPIIGYGQIWEIEYLSNGYDLNTVYFYNDVIGYAVGDNGAMIKTIDAGDNWATLSTGVTDDITDVIFINEDTGYVCTKGGAFQYAQLLETKDGGLTWVSINTYYHLSFYKISSGGLGEIILAGSKYNGNNGITNGYVCSINLNSLQFNELATNSYLIYYDLYSYSPSSFTICGGNSSSSSNALNYIYTNISGTNIGINFPSPWGSNNELFSMDVIDYQPTDIVFVGEKGGIYNMSNSSSQNNLLILNPSFSSNTVDLWSVDMINDKGWIVGDLGTILYTVDYGQTWSQYNNPILFEDLHSVVFTDPCNGYFVGENGIIGRYRYEENLSVTLCENVQNFNLYTLLDSNAINLGGVWSDSLGNPIPSLVNASSFSVGTHTLLYNFLACGNVKSSVVTLEIVENPLLSTMLVAPITCNGNNNGMVQVNMLNGSILYSNCTWSNGSVSPIAQNLIAGNYSVVVTDTNGCSSSESITVTEPNPISYTITMTDATCFGMCDASVSVSNISGGAYPFNLDWGGVNPNSLCAGNYNLTITDANNCIVTNSLVVSEPNMISVSPTVVYVSCYGGNDGSISLASSGGIPPYTYSWFNGQTTPLIDNLIQGTYNYNIIDSNGCSFNSNIVVQSPLINSSTTNPSICDGGSWTVGSNAYNTSGYYIDTLISAYGCDSIINTNLTVNALIVTQQNWVMCEGFSITVGSNTYTLPGVYSDTLLSSNGCDSVVDLSVVVNPMPYISIAQNGTVLFVDSISSNLPVSYYWSNGGIFDSIIISQTGVYSVLVTDANGCVGMDSINVTFLPTILLEEDYKDVSVKEIIDVLGRDSNPKRNTILFYIYDDGTVEKRIVIE